MLHPRTELFALATYTHARSLHPDTPVDQRAALRGVALEAGEAAAYCFPGGEWEWDNPRVRALVEDARRDAAALGVAPLDTTDPAALLLDAAVTALRNLYDGREGTPVTEVTFTAHRFADRIRWANVTGVVTRYADGSERDNISYPAINVDRFLWELAAHRPPVVGDTLTLRVAPGPSALPAELDLFEQFFGELADLDPVHVDPEPAAERAPEPEPAAEPESVKAPSRPAAPADDDYEGWVWWDIDREYVPGTVTRLHFLNNGGRSKLLVRVLDGTHKGMAPTLNRQIGADLVESAHRLCKAVYGPRSKWPTHITLHRPDTPAA